MLTTIKTIKKVKTPSKRYDLTVAKNHNFFANGVLVHNCSAYSDGYVHARSIDSRGGVDRDWVKSFLTNEVCFNMPEGWRICGENLWARHSIGYEDLESFFMGFSIWDESNRCLSWDDTVEYFSALGVVPVRVIYDDEFDEEKIRALATTKLNLECDEGYVVRLAEGFHYDDFHKSVAKYVRANHVQTDKHWRHSKIVPNKLAGI
jgi:hypothetical protein